MAYCSLGFQSVNLLAPNAWLLHLLETVDLQAHAVPYRVCSPLQGTEGPNEVAGPLSLGILLQIRRLSLVGTLNLIKTIIRCPTFCFLTGLLVRHLGTKAFPYLLAFTVCSELRGATHITTILYWQRHWRRCSLSNNTASWSHTHGEYPD